MATHVSSSQASVRYSGLWPIEASASVLGPLVKQPPSLLAFAASITNHVPAVLSEIIKYEDLSVSRYVRRLTAPDDIGGPST
jgi:hypothetical protein